MSERSYHGATSCSLSNRCNFLSFNFNARINVYSYNLFFLLYALSLHVLTNYFSNCQYVSIYINLKYLGLKINE